MSNDTRIKVAIGSFEREYVLVETTAPRRYDGLGTLEVYDSGESGELNRFVLVDIKHLEWQQGRYGSGLYTYKEVDDDLSLWVQGKLYDRISEGGEG